MQGVSLGFSIFGGVISLLSIITLYIYYRDREKNKLKEKINFLAKEILYKDKFFEEMLNSYTVTKKTLENAYNDIWLLHKISTTFPDILIKDGLFYTVAKEVKRENLSILKIINYLPEKKVDFYVYKKFYSLKGTNSDDIITNESGKHVVFLLKWFPISDKIEIKKTKINKSFLKPIQLVGIAGIEKNNKNEIDDNYNQFLSKKIITPKKIKKILKRLVRSSLKDQKNLFLNPNIVNVNVFLLKRNKKKLNLRLSIERMKYDAKFLEWEYFIPKYKFNLLKKMMAFHIKKELLKVGAKLYQGNKK